MTYPEENCHYCGELVSGLRLHRDHLKPLCRGGNSLPKNIVYACNICNSVKGRRTVKEARIGLLQKRFGWPRFNQGQIAWLRDKGFDLAELDNGKLAFEEHRP